MKATTWLQLTARQQHVLLVAIYLRNSIEDFHVAHLTDSQMKDLNQIIRQSLYDIVSIIEDEEDNQAMLSYLVAQVPDYWEIPADDYPIISTSDPNENRRAA